MALNPPGSTISLGGDPPSGQVPPGSSIAYELRGAPGATAPISLNDSDVRQLAGRAPGETVIIPNDFWGKSAPSVTPPPTTPPPTTPPPTTPPPTTPPPTTPPPTYVYFPFNLGYSGDTIAEACTATTAVYYSICSTLVANTCYLFNTANNLDPVIAGFYSNGTTYYDVNSSGLIESVGSCPPPPTPPPTPPPPTPAPTYLCSSCTRSTFTNNTGDPLTIYYGACPSGEQASVFMAYPSSPVTICYCDGTLVNDGGAAENFIEVCSGGTPAPTTPPPTTPPPTTPPPTTPPPTTPPPTTPPPTTPPPTTPPPTTPPPTTPPPTTPPPTFAPVDFTISSVCTSGTQSTISISGYSGGNGSPYYASTQLWDTPAGAGGGAISSVGTSQRDYTNISNGTWYVKVCSANQANCTVKSITTSCTPAPTTPPPTTPPPTTPPPTTPPPTTPPPTTPPPTTPPPTLPPVNYDITSICTSGTQSTITVSNYTGGDGSPYYASTQVWDSGAGAGSGAISSVGTSARNYTNINNGTWYVKVCSQNQSSCTVKSITTACTPPPTTQPTQQPTTPPVTPQPTTSFITYSVTQCVAGPSSVVTSQVLSNGVTYKQSNGNCFTVDSNDGADPGPATIGAVSSVSDCSTGSGCNA